MMTMDIKKGQWFKCIKEMKVGQFILFEKYKLYQADRDGSIDGVDHGVCFEEFFEPIDIDNDKSASEELDEAIQKQYWEKPVFSHPAPAFATGFRKGAKWQRERDILKACIWIRENAARYVVNTSIHGIPVTALHASLDDDFKKYLEENL